MDFLRFIFIFVVVQDGGEEEEEEEEEDSDDDDDDDDEMNGEIIGGNFNEEVRKYAVKTISFFHNVFPFHLLICIQN